MALSEALEAINGGINKLVDETGCGGADIPIDKIRNHIRQVTKDVYSSTAASSVAKEVDEAIKLDDELIDVFLSLRWTKAEERVFLAEYYFNPNLIYQLKDVTNKVEDSKRPSKDANNDEQKKQLCFSTITNIYL